MAQEFSGRVQIHAGHYQSTGERMAIAMPEMVLEDHSLDRAQNHPRGDSALG
jgi:hypothetical protein